MNSTGLYSPNTCKGATSVKKLVSDNSLANRLIEIVPFEYRHGSLKLLSYNRIRTDLLTREVLLRIYAQVNKKGAEVKVMETPLYYIIQYGNKPPILLNKKTGRLHAIEGLGYKKQEMEHQAGFVLSILHNHGDLVEEYHVGRIGLRNGGKFVNKERQETEKLISPRIKYKGR